VPKARPLISIIDDDHSMREAIDGLVKSVGYAVASVASAEELLGPRHVRRTSCLITDIRIPGMSGLESHQRLSASEQPIPTTQITAYPNQGAQQRALAAGGVGYLSKSFEEVDLLACIRSALTNASGAGSEGR
jgi:FixJ family two-component response regulator